MTHEMNAQVTGSIQAVITAVDETIALDDPLVAINWFDTRWGLLYDIYNFFAARSVRAVGGTVVFKGKVEKTLNGEMSDRRDMVLIVRYPSAAKFLEMVQSKYFQIVGLMRAAAVSRFTFGFTQSSVAASAQPDPGKTKAYLLCNFRGADISLELAELASRFDMAPIYGGRLAARLGTQKVGEPGIQVPCIIDASVVFQADQPDMFEALLKAPEFQDLVGKTESYFIATLTRLL